MGATQVFVCVPQGADMATLKEVAMSVKDKLEGEGPLDSVKAWDALQVQG